MIGLDRLSIWILKNPAVILAAAILLTLFSVHYAQQIEDAGLNTESFVSKDSSIYQLYDHLYQKNFGIDANVVLIEGDDVAHEDLLSASLVFSDHMRQIQNVARVQSLADMVADAEYQNNGVRRIPSQWRIEEILVSSSQAQLGSLMTDRSHSRMIVGMPATLDESERNEVLSEIYKSLDIAEFPPGYETTVTGDPAFQASVVEIMYDSNASILALAGLLMVVAFS
jgi:predicted RND superfamily exporter protein